MVWGLDGIRAQASIQGLEVRFRDQDLSTGVEKVKLWGRFSEVYFVHLGGVL